MRLSEKKHVLIKPPLVFGTAGSTTNRRVPHPLRFLQRVGYTTVGIEIRGIPPFAKSAKDGAPGDLLHFLQRTRNAPFPPPRVGNDGGRLYGKPHKDSLTPPSFTGNPGDGAPGTQGFVGPDGVSKSGNKLIGVNDSLLDQPTNRLAYCFERAIARLISQHGTCLRNAAVRRVSNMVPSHGGVLRCGSLSPLLP
jgi:hypothetical protein